MAKFDVIDRKLPKWAKISIKVAKSSQKILDLNFSVGMGITNTRRHLGVAFRKLPAKTKVVHRIIDTLFIRHHIIDMNQYGRFIFSMIQVDHLL